MTDASPQPTLAGDLVAVTNEAIKHLRRTYAAVLLVALYIAIIIVGTKDEQLLFTSQIVLPVFGVGLPIVVFYSAIPWLIVLLHFDLLLNLYLVSGRLHALRAAFTAQGLGVEEHSGRLLPFPFSDMLLSRGHSPTMRFLLAVVVWTTIVLVPLGLLLGAQLRFLPYHDVQMTWSHRLAVLLDTTLLWIFLPATMSPNGEVGRWWTIIWRGPWRRLGAVARRLGLLKTAVGAPLVDELCRHQPHGFIILALTTTVALLMSVMIAVIPEEPMERWAASVVPVRWRHQPPEASQRQYLWLTFLLFDADGAPLHRNLALRERRLVGGEVSEGVFADLRNKDAAVRRRAVARLQGVSLVNRDLRFADLRGAVLVKADLRGANLDGADLREADLAEADLRAADAREYGPCVSPAQERWWSAGEQVGAGLRLPRDERGRFCTASLRGGNLEGARLEKARLVGAALRDAKLTHAHLEEANLSGVALQWADLSFSYLDKAIFHEANMTGARLSHTRARGILLGRAVLQSADLSGAMLDGAVMNRTDLRDAVLGGASLRFAALYDADLRGAVLRGARLDFGRLPGARLQAADLRGAFLYGADLSQASLSGAEVAHADVRLADLRRVVTRPLSEGDYLEMEKVFQSELVDSKRVRTLLLRLRFATGRPVDWLALLASDGVTCDGRGQPLPSCRPVEEIRLPVERLLDYLGAAGCENRALTLSVGYFALDSNDGRWPVSFRAKLASRLLSRNCRAVTAMADEEWFDPMVGDGKEDLRRLVSETGTRSWTDPCRTVSQGMRQSLADFSKRVSADAQKPEGDRSPAMYRRLLMEANEWSLVAACRAPGTENAEFLADWARERYTGALVGLDRSSTIEVAAWPEEVTKLVAGRRIRAGMTGEQVLLAWGWPSDAVTDHAARRELWTYWGYTVEFLKGEVVKIDKTGGR